MIPGVLAAMLYIAAIKLVVWYNGDIAPRSDYVAWSGQYAADFRLRHCAQGCLKPPA